LANVLFSKLNYLRCDSKTSNHDLASLVIAHKPVGMVYDIPRSNIDHLGNLMVSYKSIESLKNKFIFSGKYQGVSRYICPADMVFKVVILANSPPDQTAMSGDRWQIYEIQKYPSHTTGVLEDRLSHVYSRYCICAKCKDCDVCLNKITCFC